MKDIKAWISFALAVALIVAIAWHEPMVIVFAFAGLGATLLVFALWLLRQIFKAARARR